MCSLSTISCAASSSFTCSSTNHCRKTSVAVSRSVDAAAYRPWTASVTLRSWASTASKTCVMVPNSRGGAATAPSCGVPPRAST
jgi:hypothetical protein